jgi:hypothetical protein
MYMMMEMKRSEENDVMCVKYGFGIDIRLVQRHMSEHLKCMQLITTHRIVFTVHLP